MFLNNFVADYAIHDLCLGQVEDSSYELPMLHCTIKPGVRSSLFSWLFGALAGALIGGTVGLHNVCDEALNFPQTASTFQSSAGTDEWVFFVDCDGAARV